MIKLAMYLLPFVCMAASNANAQCRNLAGYDSMEIRFLLQGRSVEVRNVAEPALYQSVLTGMNTGERINDLESPYHGYTIFKMSNLFGGSAPQLKIAFDRYFPMRTYGAVLFMDFDDRREILHEFICGEQ